jgi:hypothetical protein
MIGEAKSGYYSFRFRELVAIKEAKDIAVQEEAAQTSLALSGGASSQDLGPSVWAQGLMSNVADSTAEGKSMAVIAGNATSQGRTDRHFDRQELEKASIEVASELYRGLVQE